MTASGIDEDYVSPKTSIDVTNILNVPLMHYYTSVIFIENEELDDVVVGSMVN